MIVGCSAAANTCQLFLEKELRERAWRALAVTSSPTNPVVSIKSPVSAFRFLGETDCLLLIIWEQKQPI